MKLVKSQEEIDAQIKGLEEIKPNVRHYTLFGDSNWNVIDAQIRVLRDGMDDDEIYNYWNRGEEDMNVRDGALVAFSWMIGEPIEDADDPDGDLVDMWRPLAK